MSDPFDSLTEFGKVTSLIAGDRRSVDGAPSALQRAADHFVDASDGYVFAAQMLAVNQRSDAAQTEQEANGSLDAAMRALAEAGATACG